MDRRKVDALLHAAIHQFVDTVEQLLQVLGTVDTLGRTIKHGSGAYPTLAHDHLGEVVGIHLVGRLRKARDHLAEADELLHRAGTDVESGLLRRLHHLQHTELG